MRASDLLRVGYVLSAGAYATLSFLSIAAADSCAPQQLHGIWIRLRAMCDGAWLPSSPSVELGALTTALHNVA